MKKQWYAVYTKPNCELRVSAQLNRKKIDSVCPLNNIAVSNGFKKRWNSVPLFPQLVFVHVAETDLETVKHTSDVLSFLYWLGAPAVINNDDVKNLERFANDYNQIRTEKTIVNPAIGSQITSHTYEDNLALNQTMVQMSIPAFGYIISAVVETATTKVLDPISPAKASLVGEVN